MKKTATEERTYTLEELTGDEGDWWHYLDKTRPGFGLCGQETSGGDPVPIKAAVPGGRDCPDCVRIYTARWGPL